MGRDGKNALQHLQSSEGYWHEGHDQVVVLLRAAGSKE
jgi:hypothetical protein